MDVMESLEIWWELNTPQEKKTRFSGAWLPWQSLCHCGVPRVKVGASYGRIGVARVAGVLREFFMAGVVAF